MPQRYDDLERRCPRLGSVVRFHYCRTSGPEPCAKVFDCWWEQFDVAGHLRRNLGRPEFDTLAAARPPDKIGTLLDLIRQAQERIRGGADNGDD